MGRRTAGSALRAVRDQACLEEKLTKLFDESSGQDLEDCHS